MRQTAQLVEEKKIVIVPTYNEIENIRAILDAVVSLPEGFHVMVVDDGSPDGTGNAVREMMGKMPERVFLEERTGKNGLGTAYLHGFKKALSLGYHYIFEMDADFSHNPADLSKLLAACQAGADMAIGSRYVVGVNVVNWPMSRVLMSWLASKYVQFVTGMPINDATAGFKCYRRQVLETVGLDKIRFVGYAFQIEMKFHTWKCGFKIVEVPIIFTDRTKGVSKMSKRIIKEAFWGVIELKIKSFFRRYPHAGSLAPASAS